MHAFRLLLALANAAHVSASWAAIKNTGVVKGYSKVFQEKPPESPAYMVDNTDNLSGQAPNKGEYNGPVWAYSGSFDGYMQRLHRGEITGKPTFPNATATRGGNTTLHGRQSGGYWLPSLAPLGKQPLAGDGYVFYRDVTKYGASNKGDVDASEAINAAIQDGNRCGLECGNTFSQGAIIYFPAGTYKICTPIIQLYHSQFIGDPNDRPIIKGCDKFTGIALMDTDPYVPNEANPDGTGVNWYINQNQFFRQIRNFVFDLTEMPLKTDEHNQPLVPTGIHWQVSQACSLQNLLFKMPESTGKDSTTHVGIFTENGSGGFVSDLEFEGGAIGWRVGSQQYTARGLKFKNCITSIQMVWDWGFNWQDIEIDGGSIGLNISGKGGLTGQGIGSISLIDSSISNVPIGILTRDSATGDAPNIVIDNTAFDGVNALVQVENGETLLSGSQNVDLWAMGRRYMTGEMNGTFEAGFVTGRPTKPAALLGSNGKLFTRSRPQYGDLGAGSFLIATENGCANDGTGDNTAAINSFLQKAAAADQVAYFPAGIYSVSGTVHFPVNSKIVGASWSQIQATGDYFGDMKKPQVVVRVGYDGDVGTMEITDMIFSAKGPTAGAIMVEWNVKESSPGAAGMWDSHIRVGGALGSDLEHVNCPKFGFSEACITASLLFHATPKSSGYFENVWAWVADHDNDMSLYWEFDKLASQISIYAGRGMLIESQGPCWFYGTGSEHTILYQYQLHKAKNIYMGHIQTETPYFQPEPVAPTPFENSVALGKFNADPSFDDCESDGCKEAWGLRILDSDDVMIHSAGLYSWFINYQQQCLTTEDCQERMMQVRGSSRVAIFNLFTKGVTQVSTGSTNHTNIWQSDNKQGYTAEISLFFPPDGSDNIVYLGPEVYTSQTAQCEAPCTFVLAPSPLSSTTTISIPPYTTSLEVGSSVGTGFVVTTTTVTITIAPITTDKLPQSNVEVDDGQSGAFNPSPSVPISHSTVEVTDGNGHVTSRIITFPPWPQITNGPPDKWPPQNGSWDSTGGGGSGSTPTEPITWVDPPYTKPPVVMGCPPETRYIREVDAVITLSGCSSDTTMFWDCPPTKTIGIEAPTDKSFSLGCMLFTGVGEPLPTYTTWPPGQLVWDEDDGEDDDDDNKTTCRLWFFFICISWNDIKIGGWRWEFPKGVFPPGPPPTIRFPPGITIKGTLPGPWPRVTIGRDGVVTYPTNQPEQCKTKTADICATTTTLDITTSGTRTITSTRTESTCTAIVGCNVEDDDSTVTETSSCTGAPTVTLGRRDAVPLASPTAAEGQGLYARATCPEVTADSSIIYPLDPYDVQNIIDYLKFVKINPNDDNSETWWTRTKQVQGGAFTAFFFVESLTTNVLNDIRTMKADLKVADAYGIYARNREARYPGTSRSRPPLKSQTPFWELSLMSVPPGGRWSDYFEPSTNPTKFTYEADDTYGKGQTIYMIEDGIDEDHPEFASTYTSPSGSGTVQREKVRFLQATTFPQQNTGSANIEHGTEVASRAYGAMLGLAKNAELVVVRNTNRDPADVFNHIHERYLASLVEVLDDVLEKYPGNKGKVVINMSFGWLNTEENDFIHPAHWDIFYRLLKELDNLGAVLVAASHNNYVSVRDDLDGWPSRFGDPGTEASQAIRNLIVVSGIDKNSRASMLNPYAEWLAMAPGFEVNVADVVGHGYGLDDGASLAAPLVAGTIAYWRGLNIPASSGWAAELQEPANVKKLVQYMHRKLSYPSFPMRDNEVLPRTGKRVSRVPFLWTGRVKGGDCLVNPTLVGCPKDMEGRSISQFQPRGADCASSSGGSARSGRRKRQEGASCPLILNPDTGSGGGSITFSQGTPSPTCASNCGTLCSGFFCLPRPTGVPPDYWDPEDPVHKTVTAPPTSTTSTTTITTPTPNVTPLERGGVNCFREADFPGHADLQSGDQDDFSVSFSGIDVDTIGPGDAPIRYRRTDGHGVNYDYRVEWVSGCVTTVDRQSFRFPLGMSQSLITAYLLVREDYTKCNNGGVGGSCQAGCLLYTFEGGRGDDPTDPCADFDCRACGTPFDPSECQSCCRGFRMASTESQRPPGNHSHYVAGENGGIVIDDLSI